jgi:hypothetical protein
VDSHDWGAAGLTFEGDKSERFLNAWVDKQVGGPINPGQLLLIRTISEPGDVARGFPKFQDNVAIVAISDNEKVKSAGCLSAEQIKRFE